MIYIRIQTAQYLTYWPNGPWYARPIPEARFWTLWVDYTALASYSLGRQPYGIYIVAWTNNPIDSLAYALIVLPPHLLSALGGGVLGIFVAWLAGLRARRPRRDDHGQEGTW